MSRFARFKPLKFVDNRPQQQQSTTILDLTAVDDQEEWGARADAALQYNFPSISASGGFRPGQRQIICALLAKRDCFCVMPTGAGKSLCYQLPPLIGRIDATSGLTSSSSSTKSAACVSSPSVGSSVVPIRGASTRLAVVVSPLIALMEDQVRRANAIPGVKAAHYSSNLPAGVKHATLDGLRRGNSQNLTFFFVTPEFISSESCVGTLHSLQDQGLLALFAIDEAHCISEWGHDFRPAFRALDLLKVHFPAVPVLALTATANARVQQDIRRLLKLGENAFIWCGGFNRPNISYRVVHRDDLPSAFGDAGAHKTGVAATAAVAAGGDPTLVDLITWIHSQHYGKTGVVYCHKRERCEGVAAALAKAGIPSVAYHAGLPDARRQQCAADWVAGKVQVVAATVAFGMGIDKADVRFVIHIDTPKNLEAFYQESGRAGRDGNPAFSVLYFSEDDIKLHAFLINKQQQSAVASGRSTGSNKATDVALESLQWMHRFCLPDAEDPRCRRSILLRYFGERGVKCNAGCDLCQAPKRERITRPQTDRRRGHVATSREFESSAFATPHQQFLAQRAHDRKQQHDKKYGSGSVDNPVDLGLDSPRKFDKLPISFKGDESMEERLAQLAQAETAAKSDDEQALGRQRRSGFQVASSLRRTIQRPSGITGSFQRASTLNLMRRPPAAQSGDNEIPAHKRSKFY